MDNMPKSLRLSIIYTSAAADILVCGSLYMCMLAALQGNNKNRNCWVKEHNILNFNRAVSISYCCCNKLRGTRTLKQHKLIFLEFL